MQDRPAKEVLLDAIASFLLTQVKPAISDPALGFRVLIAANLATVVASEIRSGDEQNAAERERLRALLPEVQGEVPALNAALASRLREGRGDPAWVGQAQA